VGRQAYERRAWATAYTELTAADAIHALPLDDLEHLAVAACLSGHEQESEKIWTRAYQELVGCGEVQRAVRSAFWLAMMLFDKGQGAPGAGWIARARRLLDDHQRDCVERGYLLLPTGLGSVMSGDFETASRLFAEAASIGDRFDDADLRALARHGCGRALTRLGKFQDGASLFDEAMTAVASNEVSPIAAGVVYCGVIEGCYEIFDLKRAREWTAALGRWCDAQPELVAHQGICLARRSELLQLGGTWNEALAEATRACERLSHSYSPSGAGLGFYQLGELHRLRGEFAKAEDAYRLANERGKVPEPGRALLRLAEGQLDAAVSGIQHALAEARDRKMRARILIGSVDILLAAGDVAGAREATGELAAIVSDLSAPLLNAYSRQAAGAVLLAEGNPRAALSALRDAVSLWRELEIPYEGARASVLIALAYRALADRDGASLEFDAARRVFERLGAKPDLAKLAELTATPHPTGSGGLTTRETEVLGLLATGRTNRAIADHLQISEKTVARHLSNIFNKLGVSTRSAATAYAYRHKINSEF
jgi:DNA-binding CsgD family transcriptional regulator